MFHRYAGERSGLFLTVLGDALSATIFIPLFTAVTASSTIGTGGAVLVMDGKEAHGSRLVSDAAASGESHIGGDEE